MLAFSLYHRLMEICFLISSYKQKVFVPNLQRNHIIRHFGTTSTLPHWSSFQLKNSSNSGLVYLVVVSDSNELTVFVFSFWKSLLKDCRIL